MMTTCWHMEGLVEAYKKQHDQVVEGEVKVLHQQPVTGVIIVNGAQVEVKLLSHDSCLSRHHRSWRCIEECRLRTHLPSRRPGSLCRYPRTIERGGHRNLRSPHEAMRPALQRTAGSLAL